MGILSARISKALGRLNSRCLAPLEPEQVAAKLAQPDPMTARVTGIGLIPLALGAGQPGKEIQQPMECQVRAGFVSMTFAPRSLIVEHCASSQSVDAALRTSPDGGGTL